MSKKIKLKDLLNENFSGTMLGGVVSRNPFHDNLSLSKVVKEKYGDVDGQKIDIKGLNQALTDYNKLGEEIFGKSNITQISEKLNWIASQAKSHTLQETEDWFDKITVNRNMKELTGLSKQFSKISSEAESLQQRMGALYEDMGNILGRYYEIGEKHLPGHDSDDIETVDIEENAYQKFFQGAMKKFGIKSPDELDDEKKKEFFNYVDNNYTAKKERD
tara:strand:- start:11556 stop:12209 length:654 start_codon:yes stop_codon:yes gene_type:complete